MEILTLLLDRERTKGVWSDGLQWFGWTVIGGLIPLWGSAFLFTLTGRDPSWADFLSHGEFALYAASYAGGALYIAVRDFRKGSFPSRGPLVIVLVALLLFSTLTFAGVTLAPPLTGDAAEHTGSLNQPVLVGASVLLLFVTSVVALIVTVVENTLTGPDLAKSRKKSLKQLSEDFDKLGK